MNRRELLVALGLVATGKSVLAQDMMRSPHPHRYETTHRPAGSWDGPVRFKFSTGRHDRLHSVGFQAEFHGKEYGERVLLAENYTLEDMVAATQLLQFLADDQLAYLIESQV